MNILIYDNNLEDLSKLCHILEGLPLDLLIDKISNFDDGVMLYSKNQYDLIFIDFKDEVGAKLLNIILDKNPLQRVVTISDMEKCSEENGCSYCITNYNKKRLTKPIHLNDLLNVFIKKEPCALYCNDALLIKLEKISKELKSIRFNKDTFTFTKNYDTTEHRSTSDMIHLAYRLKEENIEYELKDNELKIIDINNF